MEVIYYYYYLFYKKILRDEEPHIATLLAVSLSQSLFINGFIISPVILNLFCSTGKTFMILVLILTLFFNYRYYHRSGKNKQIVKIEPTILGSRPLRIILVCSFFVLTISWLFLGRRIWQVCFK